MISAQELRPDFEVAGTALIPVAGEECFQQIVTAEKELSAFLTAVQTLYGRDVAKRAADDWIELLESDEFLLVNGVPNWRRITIIASSRLATNYLGHKPQDGPGRKIKDAG